MKKIIIFLISMTSLIFSAQIWSGYQEVTSTFVVNSGEVLVIDPGTTVRFEHNSRLVIDGGLLIAEGTEADPIRLTSLEPTVSEYDFWQGIEFYGSGNSKDSSLIKYCQY